MPKCGNPKCGDEVEQRRLLCPACQYLGRRVFAAGALMTGIAAGLLKWIGWL
jgi:hypothetical protein